MSLTTLAAPTTFSNAATLNADPDGALAELDEKLDFASASAVAMFVSSRYDPDALARGMRDRIHCPVLCCTTAGEISSELGYMEGGISAASFKGCEARLHGLDSWLPEGELARVLAREQATTANALDGGLNAVGLLAVDGLCRREESLVDTIQRRLPSVPIVGGSAGDERTFTDTRVYLDGDFHRGLGALLIIRGAFIAQPFHTHHCSPCGKRVIVTEADPAHRRLTGLDGYPALDRLAEVLNISTGVLGSPGANRWPLLRRMGNSYYVRSIRRVEADGALTLFCAVNPGDVLHIGNVGDMVETTAACLSGLRRNGLAPDQIIGFECVLRRMELMRTQRLGEMARVLSESPLAGFSTYGEQYDGVHVNQTMTGVALWQKRS